MQKRLLYLSILAVAFTLSIETDGFAVVLSSQELPSLIQKSLESNAELKALKFELAEETAKIKPAGSLEDPMVAVEAMNVPTDSFRLNEYEMTGIQISLSQKLPFPGKLAAKKTIIALRSQTLEQRIQQLQRDITWNIKRIYYELYLKLQKKTIIENQRTYLRQTLKASQSRYILNQLSQASLLNLQVEEARLFNEQLRLSSEMKNLEAELAHITGHSEHTPALEFQPIRITRLPLQLWSEDEVTRLVLAQNSELRALASEVQVSDAGLILARKNYLPDFELMANYTIREAIPGMDPPQRGQDMVGAKLGISIPIWGYDKQSEQIKEAVASRERAASVLENARLMQIHQARALFAELKESVQRIDLFEGGLLQLSQQAVAAGKAAYLTGKLEYTTLLDGLNRMQDTQYGYQEALVTYQVQMAKLEALLGQSLEAKPHD